MITIEELTNYINQHLEINLYQDYCPNGLQVQGKTSIETIVTGVTACEALIEAAITNEADCLLVHHGFFWKGEPAALTGMKGRRVGALMRNHMNLLAYHLPLDGHPVLGNNVQLGQKMGLQTLKSFAVDGQPNLLWAGETQALLSTQAFGEAIAQLLKRTPLVEDSGKPVHKVAWCTGGAQDYIFEAIQQEADTYITGEVSERTIHIARENQINFIAAGHHATERYGIQALGEHLAQTLGLKHQFIDIPNPA